MNLIDYFVDPVLRGPTLGSLFQALTTSIIGVLVFFRKETLLGESLSHATYPGLIFGLLIATLFGLNSSYEMVFAFSLAACSAWLGLKTLHLLSQHFQVRNDTALALILSSFFGFGLFLVSALQHDFGAIYKRGESLLLGQTATMQDEHIFFYAVLFGLTLFFLLLFKKEVQSTLFDPSYSKVLGLPVHYMEATFRIFFLVAIVAGIRSTGVVLVSSLLIAPPLVGFLLSDRLRTVFAIALSVGGISAILGGYFSTEASRHFSSVYAQRLVFPTGPSIALFLSFFALLAIVFAPKKGILARWMKILSYRRKRLEENLLKFLWRHEHEGVSRKEMNETFPLPYPLLNLGLLSLHRGGWILPKGNRWFLTTEGNKRGSKVVRLHRLWELYLVDILGKGKEEVHVTAEEMEHILTKELEESLSSLLDDPTVDPHHQPIPK